MTMEHCETCETWPEHRLCPDCGKTGDGIREDIDRSQAEWDKVAMHDETLPLETRRAAFKRHNQRTSS
jgi:hypothetical protein